MTTTTPATTSRSCQGPSPVHPCCRWTAGGVRWRVGAHNAGAAAHPRATRRKNSGAAPGLTLVFDEVNAGIGGTAATAVGAALARLGDDAQVLVVTHLAQVRGAGIDAVRGRQDREAGRYDRGVHVAGRRRRTDRRDRPDAVRKRLRIGPAARTGVVGVTIHRDTHRDTRRVSDARGYLRFRHKVSETEELPMSKHIFVTGGVRSLGKGLIASSLGAPEAPWPSHHTEARPVYQRRPRNDEPIRTRRMFVTEDGGETDLDLGHYERFLTNLSRNSNATTGPIYQPSSPPSAKATTSARPYRLFRISPTRSSAASTASPATTSTW